jgi:Photosynthetic reaction centre, H-chain N-terminal region
MQVGEITGYIDVAQVTLYAFWVFFAGLIIYLRTEDKREGYPLESDRSGRVTVEGSASRPGRRFAFETPRSDRRHRGRGRWKRSRRVSRVVAAREAMAR